MQTLPMTRRTVEVLAKPAGAHSGPTLDFWGCVWQHLGLYSTGTGSGTGLQLALTPAASLLRPVTSGLAVLYLCTEATPQETLQSVSNVLRCLCLCKTNLQCHLQVLAALPIARHVAGFYSHHPGFCDMLTNTAFSLAAALFVFIILPAGDFIIGVEPPEVVRLQLQPSCTVNGHDYLLLLCGHPPLLIQCASLLICW